MLTGWLSVISIAISMTMMYVHVLYFYCCIFCFLQNRFWIFCIFCAHRGAKCNICCCFFDACPWAVFLLLHILFSEEQVRDFLHNLCLQGGNCNICCCFYFYIVCPWAVFILLHILFFAG